MVGDFEALRGLEPFDCAVFYDSLHHAVDERAALTAVFKALRPGGILITHKPGAGHAKSPEALHAMQRYGVTEKDMPPAHIRNLCLEIGFSRFEFVPGPGRVVRATYGIDTKTRQRKRRSWLRRVLRIAGVLREGHLQRVGVCIVAK